MSLLEVSDLWAGYGKLQVLFNVSFSLEGGELLAVVGPNGSGKSTLLKAIFGLATIHSGKVVLEGRDITRLKPHERAKLGMAYLPQLGNVFERLTVRENLKMAGYTLEGEEFEERLREALEFLPEVRRMLDRRVWTLSGGERQMVAMAMALIRRPKVIMFDEPTATLAPKVAEQVLSKVVELSERGLGVILVEQNAKRALEVSERALLLVAGRQVFLGPSKELLNNPELSKMYLGVSG